MDDVLAELRARPARQQPDWDDPAGLAAARETLTRQPALVRTADVLDLRARLARVAAGEAYVVQAGDCAEDPGECTYGDVTRKAGLVDMLAGALQLDTGRPVLRVGRLAGQLAKPRSRDTEVVGGQELPVYRGHLVNGPEPDPERRRPDPARLVAGYHTARDVLAHLGWQARPGTPWLTPPTWASHEALLLDYELPQLRRTATGRLLLASTHWPWIGERTRQLDGAHVALLAAVVNPVACKVGPGTRAEDLVALCQRLDPHREPGRLTLIARLGAAAVDERLPVLAAAVHAAGHPVVWLVDPMHGNTVTTPHGLKTRFLETVVREVRSFQCAVREAGGVAGGLHLETTPDDVTECVADASCADRVGDKYTTLCDPRLNPSQAMSVIAAWSG
ncbi:3-deoxy-7-phosphoheptulonate synthase [Dactylosporangium sp. NPDC000555]|uniref:3-deoxy-7-phosphoheptulonate synthase n=1 Tax=Dactylosporangium sp. NPDC000555 TaxID=3154260 RepID=UPI0033215E9E